MKVKSNERLAMVSLIGLALLLASTGAMAAGGGEDELGDGICKLVNVLTGKWLFGFTILATLGAGAALLFGGEITDGLKKIATIISIVGIILVTSSLLAMAFSQFGGMAC
jgi:type IV secretory pathway VirB2 component (pilin)